VCSIQTKRFSGVVVLAICEGNLFVGGEQMKNDTLAGFLVLWVLLLALSLGKQTEILSQ